MSKCKSCDNAGAKLRCLICEQEEEINKEKHQSRQYPENTKVENTPFPELNEQERMIWVLYLANFTEFEIASILFVTQPTISRYIVIIRQKLA